MNGLTLNQPITGQVQVPVLLW